MEKYKYDESNGLWYELGEHGMYYPMVEEDRERLNVGRYGKLAMEHMKSENLGKYEAVKTMMLFPKVFNDIDEKVYAMIDDIMENKLKEEPIQEDWNIIESEVHKKMLYREAEEIALKELVYINHFANIEEYINT